MLRVGWNDIHLTPDGTIFVFASRRNSFSHSVFCFAYFRLIALNGSLFSKLSFSTRLSIPIELKDDQNCAPESINVTLYIELNILTEYRFVDVRKERKEIKETLTISEILV